MIYLLVGVPASGKTWVCNEIAKSGANFVVVRHDEHPRAVYTAKLGSLAATQPRPILAEAPFNASELVSALIARRVPVQQVLVTAPINEIERRYKLRGGKDYPANFRTNHARYEQDASRWAFRGDSQQVLEWLKNQTR